MRLIPVLTSLLLSGTALLAGCSANPVSGENQLALMSEAEEVQAGQQAHRDILAKNPPIKMPLCKPMSAALGNSWRRKAIATTCALPSRCWMIPL